jgi:threonine dehydrogenase-like Zn-dependent dehydrogenase
MGAERIIAMSRHEARQKLAREFGATDIVAERGDEGVAYIKELTDGIGADSVLECVGTQESMMQAIRATRPGGSVGYVGVPHGVELNGEELFYSHGHLQWGTRAGAPLPARANRPIGVHSPAQFYDSFQTSEELLEKYRDLIKGIASLKFLAGFCYTQLTDIE